jgi:hypothetical protein
VRQLAGLEAAEIRRSLATDKRPALIPGYVREWPAVQQAQTSPSALTDYLKRFDNGALVDALMTPPEVDGQIFYDATMSGFNFHRNRLTLSAIADQVLRYAKFPQSPAVAAQSALISACLPGFADDNRLDLTADGVQPRIWLGNRITTPAHVDEWNNIGCIVAGRRRFTLFPPDQIDNLYIGPVDFAPTGAPMSMVSLRNPDFVRYPRFREALAAAQTVEVAPGDAIFIPPLWWHHVESLESFNVLVNYWWHDRAGDGTHADSAFDAMLHGMLSIRSLPPDTRRAWSAFFEHYVFGPGESATEHIPPHRHGVLGDLSPEQRAALRKHLRDRLKP